jgi:RNA polymerase sigma-70 factor (ECF subfamily)
MKDLDLNPWLIRMSQGDQEAFQVVYESTRDHAYKLIYYLAANKQDIGDIMSEVYMELLRCAGNYRAEHKFSSWFNGLIVRQVRNWQRKSWLRFRLVERVKSFAYDPSDRSAESSISALGDRLELIPLVETLPLKLKEVVVLRYFQDCSLEEIAQLLKIPIGTVKSRHHVALKKLRHLLDRKNLGKEKNEYVY